VSLSLRVSGLVHRSAIVVLALGAFSSVLATAQTAPQLLPYTSQLLAGGGATATFTPGQTCPVAGAPYMATDKYGDGCLATEVQLGSTYGGPRGAAADTDGNVFFADYSNGLIRRIDVVSGIITAVVGSATISTSPGAGAACGTAATPKSTDILGDGCLGSQVKLGRPGSVAFDKAGNLYFSDTYNYNVREVALTVGYLLYTTITNAGTGYTTAPTVTFSAPASGTTATGTAYISAKGLVLGVAITNPGSGYTTAPTMTFSAPPTGLTATAFANITTGISPSSGTISLVDGDAGGTKSTYGYESNNGSLTSCTQTGAVCINAATQGYLDGPAQIAVDPTGNVYIAEYYDTAILAVNPTTTTSTITSVSIPPGTISKIMGAAKTTNNLAANGVAGVTVCPNGTGCGYNPFSNGAVANASQTDYPFGVSYDLAGNVYYSSEYYDHVAQINPAGIVNNYAGEQGTLGKGLANTTRGLAGTFAVGAVFSVTADNYNPGANIYFPDSTNGLIWRVDGSGQNMYAVGGGATTVCAAATDAFGDGCPALQATFSSNGSTGSTSSSTASGVFGTTVDSFADLFVADQKNNLVREIASGIQFGVVGANQPVQTIQLHFASGDPTSSATFSLTKNPTNFSLGKLSCGGANSDGTTDCTLPITATPTVLGAFTSTLTVTSHNGTNSFVLNGIYELSPKTRTTLSITGETCTTSTTVSNTLALTLTATVVSAGASTPTGTVNFYANGGATPLNPTPLPLTLLSTGTYGVVYNYTFSTPGTYAITAKYSGDGYYITSTSSPSSITSAVPSFTLTPVAGMQSSVIPGQTALYSFTVGETVYAGNIGFVVTGLPAYATYAITPTALSNTGCTLATAQTVALSIFTQVAQTTVKTGGFGGTGHGPMQMIAMLAGLGLALMVGLRRRTLSARLSQITMAFALLLISTGMVACSSGLNLVNTPATPTGTYTITITPTTTVGTAPAAITFPLVVHN
jgi:streptogramin lyase